MTRLLRSEYELQKISEHLFYEMAMLANTAQLLASGHLGESTLQNAVLESYSIHLRTLMDFLYADTPRRDDAVAEDFMPHGIEWSTRRPKLTEALVLARRRVGKEIAHLSYERINARSDSGPVMKSWPFLALAMDIRAAFKAFVSLSSKSKLDPQWKSHVET